MEQSVAIENSANGVTQFEYHVRPSTSPHSLNHIYLYACAAAAAVAGAAFLSPSLPFTSRHIILIITRLISTNAGSVGSEAAFGL